MEYLIPVIVTIAYIGLWYLFTIPMFIKKTVEADWIAKAGIIFLHLYYWCGIIIWIFYPEKLIWIE